MKTEKIGNHTIKLYDSIDELPIVRFADFNKYLMIDAGIGGDMDAVDERITMLYKYINSGMVQEAQKELMNMRQSFYFIMERINPHNMAFVCMIHSIDDKPITSTIEEHLTEDTIKDVLKNIASFGITKGKIREVLNAIKKKMT